MGITKQFIHFSGVGVVGTTAHYAVLILSVNTLAVHPVVGSTIGFVVGALVNYYLNYRFTFRSNKRHRTTIVKFFSVATIGLLLNGVMMYILTVSILFPYLLAQVISTALTLIWNFSGNRIWTFSEKQP